MSTSQPITGIEIRGYRSFFGEPQKIYPLDKMTILAGANNSGKSNILHFIHEWLPRMRERSVPELQNLEKPIMPDGTEPPPLRFGFAQQVADPVGYFNNLETSFSNINPAAQEAVRRLLEDPALFDETDGAIWLRFSAVSGRAVLSDEQIGALADSLRPQSSQLADASSRLRGNAGSIEVNISNILEFLIDQMVFPRTAFIPAFREIVSEGQPTPDLSRLDGRGLPGFLHALHSPSAERHREDTKKFRQINSFLQSVLEDESAEITIPYNSSTVHVSVSDRVLPIERLGAGISQVVMIAAASTWFDNALICVEEPEVHLHPLLLRKLALYLQDGTTNRYLLSTHSSSLMDNPQVTVVGVSHTVEGGTTTRTAITESHRAQVSKQLGFRASDILQSNYIIWVEGPSDRIYVRHWLAMADSRLIEGIHYTIMFYGGKLLSHLSGSGSDDPELAIGDFISLLQINRNMAVVIDSDLKSELNQLRATKVRIRDEFSKSGGYVWITEGREIENYIPFAAFSVAAKSVHPSAKPINPRGKYADMFSGVKRKTGKPEVGVETPNKVKIAVSVAESTLELWDTLDLRQRVSDLTTRIGAANHMDQWNVPRL